MPLHTPVYFAGCKNDLTSPAIPSGYGLPMPLGPTTNQRPFRGLALPLVRVGGGRLQTKQRDDVCWGDLVMAVFCPLGGRPMARGFGSLVSQAVFEPITDVLEQRISQYVHDAATRHVPHVRVLGVSVNLANARDKVVSVSITFRPIDEDTVQTRLVKVDQRALMVALKA